MRKNERKGVTGGTEYDRLRSEKNERNKNSSFPYVSQYMIDSHY